MKNLKKENLSKISAKEKICNMMKRVTFFICAYGRKLVRVGSRTKKSKSNYESKITIYECLNCDGCPYRDRCNKGKSNKKLYVAKNFIAKRQQSLENITTPKDKLLRMNRSIQVEGAF